ncbi:MAG: type 1 glutamine amidotransferase domain-containing protein [Peptostreptococcus sp.]|uniref:type 1 glutamine amidotransferase domain-containing protein n=1 Tax=Peptostreptococcus sp. TaxID=1262 RepID=UPI002FC8EF21
MKKILVVETNVCKYAKSNRATGLWLGESVHFFEVMTKAGYEVDFMSPTGGYVPIDPYSFKYASDKDWKWYADKKFQDRALANTKKPDEVNPDDYIAIYYAGGHGAVWDFPNDKNLQKIAERIYFNGGFITSVCHGVVGLLNLKDKCGNLLIKEKEVTGFSDTEELFGNTKGKVPFSTEGELLNRGARYTKRRAFTEYAISDGRIITGQNVQSSKKVANMLVEELRKIEA